MLINEQSVKLFGAGAQAEGRRIATTKADFKVCCTHPLPLRVPPTVFNYIIDEGCWTTRASLTLIFVPDGGINTSHQLSPLLHSSKISRFEENIKSPSVESLRDRDNLKHVTSAHLTTRFASRSYIKHTSFTVSMLLLFDPLASEFRTFVPWSEIE